MLSTMEHYKHCSIFLIMHSTLFYSKTIVLNNVLNNVFNNEKYYNSALEKIFILSLSPISIFMRCKFTASIFYSDLTVIV